MRKSRFYTTKMHLCQCHKKPDTSYIKNGTYANACVATTMHRKSPLGICRHVLVSVHSFQSICSPYWNIQNILYLWTSGVPTKCSMVTRLQLITSLNVLQQMIMRVFACAYPDHVLSPYSKLLKQSPSHQWKHGNMRYNQMKRHRMKAQDYLIALVHLQLTTAVQCFPNFNNYSMITCMHVKT